MAATIFVNIPSYMDEELPCTVGTLFAHADQPDRVHVSIVDQCEIGKELHTTLAPFAHAVTYLALDYRQARGVCFARALGAQAYRGEDIYLQLDAHTYVMPGWDTWVETLMANAPTERCVYSSYPAPYTRGVGGVEVDLSGGDGVVVHMLNSGCEFLPEKWTLMYHGEYHKRSTPVRSQYLAAGLVIAPGRVVMDVPHDPLLYFYGEEQAWSIRLYTHGYDLWHPVQPPFYHLYNNVEQSIRPTQWTATHDTQRKTRWWQYEDMSVARQQALYTGEPLGVFGLGTQRTLQDFAEFSGIDYRTRTIAPRAYGAQYLPDTHGG
jgi:hypothetical protein